jgi:hypothetical protein
MALPLVFFGLLTSVTPDLAKSILDQSLHQPHERRPLGQKCDAPAAGFAAGALFQFISLDQ